MTNASALAASMASSAAIPFSSSTSSTSSHLFPYSHSNTNSNIDDLESNSSPLTNPCTSPNPYTPTTILDTLQQQNQQQTNSKNSISLPPSGASSPLGLSKGSSSPSASKHHTFGRSFVQPLRLPSNTTASGSSDSLLTATNKTNGHCDVAQNPVSVSVLFPGVVLIRNCLTPAQQVELANAVCMGHGRVEVTSPITQTTSPLCERTSIFALHHKDALNRAPTCLQRCIESALAHCRSLSSAPTSSSSSSSAPTASGEDGNQLIPPTFVPRHITAERYAAGDGVLRSHCDKLSGWAVLFALGCSARLTVSKGSQPESGPQTHPFGSGDAFIFNGGEEWGVFYGLSEVETGTCPNYIRERCGIEAAAKALYSPLHKVIGPEDILVDGALIIHARQGRDEKIRRISRTG